MANTDSDEKLREYESSEIRVHWRPGRCIHAGECVRGLPGVFKPRERPWVTADAAEADKLAEVIERCPTGALSYSRLDGQPGESATAPNAVRVAGSGPLFLRGDLTITDSEDAELLRANRVALCRCGRSARKPWCDGSHVKARFSDECGLEKTTLKASGSEEAASLVVKCLRDGPLRLIGRAKVQGKGDTRYLDGQVHLCRCGASKSKPLCDGSHTRVDFTEG